jgi:hypothetical protein
MVILVCPLIIRSILSFIPSHKWTPWDTNPGSQTIRFAYRKGISNWEATIN